MKKQTMNRPSRMRFIAAAAAAAMSMQGSALVAAAPTNSQWFQPEAIVRSGLRQTGKQQKKRNRRKTNQQGHKANRRTILEWWNRLSGKEKKAFDLIQAMTNWQNFQWRKAGGRRDLTTVEKFSALQR